MENHESTNAVTLRREPWNKGKLTGQKLPLRPKHVWSIRTKLQVGGRIRDLAMFNLALDSELRGCDVVALKVEDVAPNGYLLEAKAAHRAAMNLCPGNPTPTGQMLQGPDWAIGAEHLEP